MLLSLISFISLDFSVGKEWLENPSGRDIAAALGLARGWGWRWAPRNAPGSPGLQAAQGKPSVSLAKGFASPRSPPPAARLRPQLPCFDEHWGNESPAFKNTLLLFRWKEESCLPTLAYKNRLSVSKSSKFLLVNISSLTSFFLTYMISLFIECPSFLLLYQDICRRLLLVLFRSPEIICRAFETSSCCIVVLNVLLLHEHIIF